MPVFRQHMRTQRICALLAILFLTALAHPILSAPVGLPTTTATASAPAAEPEPEFEVDSDSPSSPASLSKRGLFGFEKHVAHQHVRPHPAPAVGLPSLDDSHAIEYEHEYSPYASRPKPWRPATIEVSAEELAYPLCSGSVLAGLGYHKTPVDNEYWYEYETERDVDAELESADYAYSDTDDYPFAYARPSVPAHTGPSAPVGYAHYAGYRVLADDVSGAMALAPEASCLAACRRYGPSCGGVSYDGERQRCWFKGKRAGRWTFIATGDEEDGVDLAGGCARWKNRVSATMDAACCRL